MSSYYEHEVLDSRTPIFDSRSLSGMGAYSPTFLPDPTT